MKLLPCTIHSSVRCAFYSQIFKRLFFSALTITVLFAGKLSAQSPWQKVTMPALADVAKNFKTPPSQYSSSVTWGWDGPMSREVISRDLDKLYSLGFRVATIEAGYNMPGKYLSETWFQLIKTAAEEAKKRGMHLWIIDEGKYPSGFAGGKFSEERPDLRMQGLVVAGRMHVTGGQVVDNTEPAEVISAMAVSMAGSSQAIAISNGKLHWAAPAGSDWDITLVKHQFRTSVTRSANNPTKGKDANASLCDYLNPEATRQFLAFTHEQYKKYMGNEFGKTILGFRGDEPAFLFTPWSPAITAEFQKKKGYDVVPYLASFFIASPTPEQVKVKADYYDVWSDMFGDNFFKVQADWCEANGIEYMVHLDKDDDMQPFVRSGGDFFKDMRPVQIPGVDAIWHQIWPDTVSNFPKFASSVAHVYNKPRALSESFAAYRPRPNDEQAKWVINQEMVRGINVFEMMFFSASASSGKSNPQGYMAEAGFPDLMQYTNRACYLLSMGRPAAQVAVYLPTTSLWMGDTKTDKSEIDVAEQLLDTQHDFDFVSEQALATDLTLVKGAFTTAGGTAYKTVVIPAISVIGQAVLDRLKAFAAQGGHVIFIGKTPGMVAGQTFLNARQSTAADFTWAGVHTGNLDFSAIANPDVKLAAPEPSIKYIHRVIKDADVYFFFNESDKEQNNTVKLAGAGNVQEWDAMTGSITTMGVLTANGIGLKLKPSETKFYIISKSK